MEILIGGLDEKHAEAVEADVRRTMNALAITDIVTIAVLPSDANNRWDIGMRRKSGWSVVSFDSAAENLSTEVANRLRTSVRSRNE